ncbi:MAG: hypothetical protein ACFBSC_14910 [Microcoleaceae cyanobacterium]
MYSQFRNAYPTGSLISELLAIDEGQFVVRAIVEVDEVILTTAISAAKTVELAEDQAKRRVLFALGIEIPATLPQIPARLVSNASDFQEETTKQSDDETKLEMDSAADGEDWLSDNAITAAAQKSDATSPTLPEFDPESEGNVTTAEPLPETATASETPSRSKRTTIEATDFSSDIAKTDIELKRLGWTPEQGVSYLQKTYGKRSRRTLTEDELLDFLHHLEALPNPGEE